MALCISDVTAELRLSPWIRAYMETLMLLSILLDREPNYDRITHGLLDGMNIRLVMLRRRSWSARFFSSYKDWRKYLGVKSSIHAAWRISR